MLIAKEDALSLNLQDLLKDQYPDAVEEINCKIPKPLVEVMEITALVVSDHTHDNMTHRSTHITTSHS